MNDQRAHLSDPVADPLGYEMDQRIAQEMAADGQKRSFKCRRCGACCSDGPCRLRPVVLKAVARWATSSDDRDTQSTWADEHFVGWRRPEFLKTLTILYLFKPKGKNPENWEDGGCEFMKRKADGTTACRLWAVPEFRAMRRLHARCDLEEEDGRLRRKRRKLV